MPVYDVMLETAPSDLKLLKALCECFEDGSENASFLKASIEPKGAAPASLITVDRWPLTGDFALYASVATPMKSSDADVAAFLARAFKTRALYRATDGDADAASFVRVDPEGRRERVHLAEVDDAREIRIEAVAAFAD